MKGLIFNIKRYAIHDGPGIRVTFFMKGCPLACWWCHNPEGINPGIETAEQTRKVGEKEFIKVSAAGEYFEVKDVLKVLEKDRVFIEKSGGGVSFSGGEPMFQHEFLAAALNACRKEGFHTVVDTSGYFSIEAFRLVQPNTNMFLFDLKHLNKAKHVEYTGVSNELILANFQNVLNSGSDVILRLPVIPGFNDEPDNLSAVRDLIQKAGNESLKQINLLPFHKTGSSKYKRFNREYRLESVIPPAVSRMKELKDYFSETGVKVKIGG